MNFLARERSTTNPVCVTKPQKFRTSFVSPSTIFYCENLFLPWRSRQDRWCFRFSRSFVVPVHARLGKRQHVFLASLSPLTSLVGAFANYLTPMLIKEPRNVKYGFYLPDRIKMTPEIKVQILFRRVQCPKKQKSSPMPSKRMATT